MSSPYINHFIQPDSLIPDPSNPQAWNRYSYVMNRPVNFNDPTGHMMSNDDQNGGGHCDNKCLETLAKKETGCGGLGQKKCEMSDKNNNPKIITIDLPDEDLASIDSRYDLNLIFYPFANDKLLMQCQSGGADCTIVMPLVRPHWDWSGIDWKTTGIDTISTMTSVANLKWASDGLRYLGRLSNSVSTANTFAKEMNRREGDVGNSILNTNTMLSVASYAPVYGVIPSAMSVLNDISAGYWEEEINYGPFIP